MSAIKWISALINFGAFCFLFAFSPVYGQSDPDVNVVFESENTSWYLPDFFDFIREETKVIISYGNQLPTEESITFSKKEYILSDLFDLISERLDLQFINTAKNRFIVKKQPANLMIRLLILDEESGERLIGANIFNERNLKGASSNENGMAYLSSSTPMDSLLVSYVGYERRYVREDERFNNTYKITLKRSGDIDEVLITNRPAESPMLDFSEKVSKLEMQSQALFRQADPISVVAGESAVQSGREGQNGIYVRGGSIDQNLVLMDGVPIYESTHFLGLSSVFNPTAISATELFVHGIPSEYGGRVSSVVNFHLDNGNLNRHSMEMHLNPIAFGLSANGPLSRYLTYNVNYRRSLIDPVYTSYIRKRQNQEAVDVDFHDLNFKVSINQNGANQLQLFRYSGKDDVFFESLSTPDIGFQVLSSDELNWGNTLWGLKGLSVISESFSFNYLLYSTSFQRNVQSQFTEISMSQRSEQLDILSQSRVKDFGVKMKAKWYFEDEQHVTLGAEGIQHDFLPSILQSRSFLPDNAVRFIDTLDSEKGKELSLFSDFRKNITSQLSLNGGVRVSSHFSPDKSYYFIEPRIHLKWSNRISQLYANYDRASQYVHLLVNPGVGLPSELWIPSSKDIAPVASDQFTVGYKWKPNGELQIGASIYYKRTEGLIDYESPFDLYYSFINSDDASVRIDSYDDWQQVISFGKSTSLGFEYDLRFERPNWSARLSGSFNSTRMTFEEIDGGLPFASRYDRPIDLKASGQFKINREWKFKWEYIYGSGENFTLADQSQIDLDGNEILITPRRNNFRFQSFQRFNASVTYQIDMNPTSYILVEMGARNIFNRNNPIYAYVYKNEMTDKFEIKTISLFPVLPYVSFTLKI